MIKELKVSSVADAIRDALPVLTQLGAWVGFQCVTQKSYEDEQHFCVAIHLELSTLTALVLLSGSKDDGTCAIIVVTLQLLWCLKRLEVNPLPLTY